MLNYKQGENVKIAFYGPTLANGVGSNSTSPVTLFTAENKVRTLLASERLVVDSAWMKLFPGLSDGMAVFAAVAGGSAISTAMDTGAGLLFPSTLIGLYDATGTSQGHQVSPMMFHFHGEGLPCPAGVTPSVFNTAADNSVVALVGLGRIVEVTVSGTQPTWKANR